MGSRVFLVIHDVIRARSSKVFEEEMEDSIRRGRADASPLVFEPCAMST